MKIHLDIVNIKSNTKINIKYLLALNSLQATRVTFHLLTNKLRISFGNWHIVAALCK